MNLERELCKWFQKMDVKKVGNHWIPYNIDLNKMSL